MSLFVLFSWFVCVAFSRPCPDETLPLPFALVGKQGAEDHNEVGRALSRLDLCYCYAQHASVAPCAHACLEGQEFGDQELLGALDAADVPVPLPADGEPTVWSVESLGSMFPHLLQPNSTDVVPPQPAVNIFAGINGPDEERALRQRLHHVHVGHPVSGTARSGGTVAMGEEMSLISTYPGDLMMLRRILSVLATSLGTSGHSLVAGRSLSLLGSVHDSAQLRDWAGITCPAQLMLDAGNDGTSDTRSSIMWPIAPTVNLHRVVTSLSFEPAVPAGNFSEGAKLGADSSWDLPVVGLVTHPLTAILGYHSARVKSDSGVHRTMYYLPSADMAREYADVWKRQVCLMTRSRSGPTVLLRTEDLEGAFSVTPDKSAVQQLQNLVLWLGRTTHLPAGRVHDATDATVCAIDAVRSVLPTTPQASGEAPAATSCFSAEIVNTVELALGELYRLFGYCRAAEGCTTSGPVAPDTNATLALRQSLCSGVPQYPKKGRKFYDPMAQMLGNNRAWFDPAKAKKCMETQ